MATRRRLLLIGAGHAHLHLLSRAADFDRAGHDLVCIAPTPFWYSGRATAMLGGEVEPAADQVEIGRLAAATGCRFLDDEVTRLDPDRRLAVTAANGTIRYDIASLAIGSRVVPLPGAPAPDTYAAKPIARLLDLRRRLEAAPPGPPPRILVVGAGMSAAELAANLACLHARLGRPARLTLVCAAPAGLLPDAPIPTRRSIRAALSRHGIAVREDGPVLRIEDHRAILPHDTLAFDLLLNATGLAPPAILAATGLALDAAGALRVDRSLRSISHPNVYGAGDCIAWPDHPLPRAGVYAVREAPVLRRNLLAALEDREPEPFHPRRHHLWIMNLGDGTGLASYAGRHWRGRTALAVKHRLDRRFLDALNPSSGVPQAIPPA